MTTKEYLNQINKINLMIEAKLEDIACLRNIACRITVPTENERVKSSIDIDKMSNAVTKIIELEKETEVLVDELIKKRKMIIKQIDDMDNSDYYSFLTYKYVQLLQTKEIAGKMGIAKSAMFKIQNEALREFEERYGTEYLDNSESVIV